MYALVAIVFTLFFGVLDLVNFAHGEMAMLGVFISMALVGVVLGGGGAAGGSPGAVWLLCVVAVALVGAIGVLMYRIALRRLRAAPPLLMLLATVGVGIMFRETVRLSYPAGSNPQIFPKLFPTDVVHLGPAAFSYESAAILAIAGLAIVFTDRFINRTRIGATIRATAQDREAAMMMGINLDITIAVTFLLGSALGAVAGILNGAFYGVVRYDMGLLMAIKGFSAAVVGGLGSFYGALVGSLVLALVETGAVAYVPLGSQLRDIFSFLVVITFLIFRPTGILGERLMEKV
jgi:branched-chain amino acid transport system permease protein